ncbi:MAG: NmrA family NAD(P)-binding protein [Phycisphaerales bacterium]|nr:NmrA family NAD(P)-binding protein [Hyphomonadaceae bacterium]
MTRHAFVAGAGGAVGEAAALALLSEGWRVTASMRRQREDIAARLQSAGAEVLLHDLPGDGAWAQAAEACDTLVFTPHLAITLAALGGAAFQEKRLVVFSSNNVAADAEAPSYRALADAEDQLRDRFANIAILRPTLIYGDPRLVTVTRLMRMAQKFPALPLPGSGRALAQPVFHEDLGRIAAGLAGPDAPAGTFAVGGPDIVTMRELYAAIAAAVGQSRLILPLPRFALSLAARAGFLSDEQAARAESDRTVIAQDALPLHLAPRTHLREGLARLFSAMGGSPGGG